MQYQFYHKFTSTAYTNIQYSSKWCRNEGTNIFIPVEIIICLATNKPSWMCYMYVQNWLLKKKLNQYLCIHLSFFFLQFSCLLINISKVGDLGCGFSYGFRGTLTFYKEKQTRLSPPPLFSTVFCWNMKPSRPTIICKV